MLLIYSRRSGTGMFMYVCVFVCTHSCMYMYVHVPVPLILPYFFPLLLLLLLLLPQLCPTHTSPHIGVLVQSLLLATSEAPNSGEGVVISPQLSHFESFEFSPTLRAHAYITLGGDRLRERERERESYPILLQVNCVSRMRTWPRTVSFSCLESCNTPNMVPSRTTLWLLFVTLQ